MTKLQPHGFSLMEVMVATAILFGSTIALVQLARVGQAHLRRSSDRSIARLLCVNKINELLAGLEPIESVEPLPFVENPDWSYSVRVAKLDIGSLAEVIVAVRPTVDVAIRQEPARSLTATYRIVRWVRMEESDNSFSREPVGDTQGPTPMVQLGSHQRIPSLVGSGRP